MKTYIKKTAAVILAVLLSSAVYSQQKINNLEFDGENTEILKSSSTSYGKGTLFSGEAMTTECAQGTCYIKIDYKGRTIEAPIGESIASAGVFEFDFGGDGDMELVVVNDSKGTSVLFVFAYARGIIQKLYEKEIFNNRTVIKTDYIEVYSPSGLDAVWNYYQGIFWLMKPVEI
ncbi:hypothetical protein ACFLR8_04825 [Bacteroidota bacterium]